MKTDYLDSLNKMNLNDGQRERYLLVAEECSEVSQAICKLFRFGPDSRGFPESPLKWNNKEYVEREVADLLFAINVAVQHGDIDIDEVMMHSKGIAHSKQKALHHQGELVLLKAEATLTSKRVMEYDEHHEFNSTEEVADAEHGIRTTSGGSPGERSTDHPPLAE